MIISHEHRYIFVEIPHTGSHSIAAELVEFYGGQRILRKHANLTQYLTTAPPEQRRYFVFGTVRNPLDTAVTDYSKLQSNHRGNYTNPEMFMENGGHVTEQHRREYAYVQEGGDFRAFMEAFRSKIYHNWFLLGARRYDFVLRFENLGADFATALAKLRLTKVRDLPHVNPTKKKSRRFEDFYPPEMREFAARYYGPFMRYWGYEFPASWGAVRVPLGSRARFAAVEHAVNLVARFRTLDPDDPRVRRIKGLVERVT